MQKKFNYSTPMVKVVAFQVEEGFAGTGDPKIGSVEATNPVYGSEQMITRDWWESATN